MECQCGIIPFLESAIIELFGLEPPMIMKVEKNYDIVHDNIIISCEYIPVLGTVTTVLTSPTRSLHTTVCTANMHGDSLICCV